MNRVCCFPTTSKDMATQYAVSQPPATSGTAAAGYQDKTAEYGYEDPQHNPASATASEFDRQNRQESWPGTANASDSPFPLHQTFSPHIPPASTGTHHHAISGIGSPFPPFSPHGHFGDSLSSGTGGGGGGEAGASLQHQQFHHPTHSPTHAGEHNTGVPEIGHVRCYWAILSAELEYAYLGPVFAAHLGDEVAERLKGTSLLDWVHPDERDQLAKDLLPHPDRLAGVEETGVFGSVTRYVSLEPRLPMLPFRKLIRAWTDQLAGVASRALSG